MVIIDPLSDQTVFETEQVTFLCKVSPTSQLAIWHKDGAETSEGDLVSEAVPEGVVHSLTIASASVDSAGEYLVTCGEAQSRATLTVKGENG